MTLLGTIKNPLFISGFFVMRHIALYIISKKGDDSSSPFMCLFVVTNRNQSPYGEF